MGQRQTAAAPGGDGDEGGPSPGDQGSSPLERGLHAVVGTFYRYAGTPGGGREPSLDPPAFQRLLRRELGRQLTDTGQPQAVAAIFALLDADGDRRISFAEYWQLVAWLCHVLRHRHYGAAPAPPPPPLCGDPHGPHPAPDAAPPGPGPRGRAPVTPGHGGMGTGTGTGTGDPRPCGDGDGDGHR